MSRRVIQYVSRISVLATEPAFQHTTRIYLGAGIDRSNVLFVPLISLSAGMGVSLLQSFNARWWIIVGLTGC